MGAKNGGQKWAQKLIGAKTNGRQKLMGAQTNGRQKCGVDRDFLLVEED